MPLDQGFSPLARFIVVAGAFALVVVGVKAMAPLVGPFLLGGFIAIVAAPLLFYLRDKGFPTLAVLITIGVIMALIGGLVGLVVTASIEAFNSELPKYTGKLTELALDFAGWLERLGIVDIPDEKTVSELVDAGKAAKWISALLGGIGSFFTNAFLVLLTVVFILAEATSLPAKLRRAAKTPEESIEQWRNILESINHYMVLKTLISLVTGFLIWAWLRVHGVDFPLLWAVVAFLLNFIPTIGSIVAAIPAVLLALVQLGPSTALWVAAGYVIVNTLIGNFIEPRVMGKGLGLSPLVVFVSLVFWGWVLGPIGMFLSVPLTMSIKIALDANPQSQSIAIMLGPEIPAREVREDDSDKESESATV